MQAHVLGLNSETLEEFRQNFDMAIRSLVNNLTERDLETGTVTAKIKITIKKELGGQALPATMMKIEPDVGIKIGASGKVKCGEQNGIYLKYDGDGMPIVGDHQMSIDEYIMEREGRSA